MKFAKALFLLAATASSATAFAPARKWSASFVSMLSNW
jgi:hypothetical protein